LNEPTDEAAYRIAMKTITRHFGSVGDQILDILVRMSYSQTDYLVYGKVNGVGPSDIEKRNGMAYIEGWDTFADIGTTFESFLSTQPRRLQLTEFRTSLITSPNYSREIEPLLDEMEISFTGLAKELEALRSLVPNEALSVFDDILDGSLVVGYRTTQVHALYDYASTHREGDTEWRAERLQVAVDALSAAETTIRRREAAYRVPLERIAGWRKNPTVYVHTLLWHAKSLYYFWRDHDKAVFADRVLLSPCYMNVINGADVAFGEGPLFDLSLRVREWAEQNRPSPNWILDCVAAPLSEPFYPIPINETLTFTITDE